MSHSSQIYDTLWDLSKVGGSQQQSFEAIKSPFNMVSPLQTSSPALRGTSSCTSFHQHEREPHHLINNLPSTFCSEPLLFRQSSGDNFTVINTKQDPPTSQFSFTNSLHSIVESFLSSSEESFSSSESDFPRDKVPLYDHLPQENNLLASDAAKDEKKPPEISFQRNQLALYAQPDEWCTGTCGIACVPSSTNSACRSSPTRKRRIRWTKDLHEPFIMIVNRLGGPEKAKPKTILEMMDSDVLTISHVKSHLQKYRFTIHMRKALQERSEEGNRPDGVSELQLKINKQIEESRQLQLEVQKSLQEQVEMQRNLHLLIEQQREQLKIMLDHQKQRSKVKVSVSE